MSCDMQVGTPKHKEINDFYACDDLEHKEINDFDAIRPPLKNKEINDFYACGPHNIRKSMIYMLADPGA